jgi:NDP-sugar pyrophosphorylase family protein
VITGTQPITIGPHAVLHPHGKVTSGTAPVVVGEGCVVFEKAVVGVGLRDGFAARGESRADGVVLGRNVVVETGAVVEAAEVGEGTVVEAGARLGAGVVVGKVCVSACVLSSSPRMRGGGAMLIAFLSRLGSWGFAMWLFFSSFFWEGVCSCAYGGCLRVSVVLHDNCVYNHLTAFSSPGLYSRVRGLRAPDRHNNASKGRLTRD